MGFWIFMFIMELLIPFVMICFGYRFYKKAPKKINYTFGYRTSMSMKNKETWEFAHKYCGKIWLMIGIILLLISIVTMEISFGKEANIIGTYGGILVTIQLLFLIGSIFPTEIKLKKVFDTDGNRRN